jgi:16S rRNA (cytidine1402-2'-O)-methyltransferase
MHPPTHEKPARPDPDAAASAAEGAAGDASNAALYVVATPIGNLEDLGARAARILRSVDLIACEDTRTSGTLLREIGASARCVSFHAHNEAQMTARLLERLQRGERIALISDAGTPGISDPGARLLRAAVAAGLRVVPIPGPSAVTTLVSVAGLLDGRFAFEGFLPTRTLQRRSRIAALDAEDRAFVLFEAPHRIEAAAADLLAVLGGQREVVVGRELTKQFEQIVRRTLADMATWLAADAYHRRGEFVLVVPPREAAAPAGPEAGHEPGAGSDAGSDDPPTAVGPSPLGRKAMAVLCESMPPRQAAKLAARISGDRADDLYAFKAGQPPRA